MTVVSFAELATEARHMNLGAPALVPFTKVMRGESQTLLSEFFS